MSFKKIGFIHKKMDVILESEDDSKIMKEFFESRTNKHVGFVRDYLKLASEEYPEYAELLQNRGMEHDASKYRPPEYEPYVHLTWQYKQKGEGEEYQLDEDMQKRIHDVTYRHCKGNKHHPEYWDNEIKENPISFENRDQPSGITVNAIRMDRPSMIEMCCDWCSVSAERNPANEYGPMEWAEKNINHRWTFSPKQEKFIYEVLDHIWKPVTQPVQEDFIKDEE